jgi:hypothetical protein
MLLGKLLKKYRYINNMKKLLILSSISLLTTLMMTPTWADNHASDPAKTEASTTATATEEKAKTEEAAQKVDTSEKSETDKSAEKADTSEKAEADKPADKASAEKSDAATETKEPTEAAATLYIISPKDGDEVTSPVTVVFGLKGMGVAPAGVEKDNTGHHHLLIDQKELPTEGIPMGADVKHFGGGQTQADVELSSGEHTLQLILGDMAHVPLSPALTSEKIAIKVK